MTGRDLGTAATGHGWRRDEQDRSEREDGDQQDASHHRSLRSATTTNPIHRRASAGSRGAIAEGNSMERRRMGSQEILVFSIDAAPPAPGIQVESSCQRGP